jgi:hypothetical protein
MYPALATLAVAATALFGPGPGVSVADDVGTYSGTDCPPDQIFDASQQACTSAVVGDAPPAPVADPGTYDGTRCAPTTYYDTLQTGCASDIVTNDPQAPLDLEGEDPTQLTVPTVSNMPGCGGTKDPFGYCGS